MDPYRQRLAAFDDYWAGVRLFRQRPFPTDWARVVDGVGLASFTMRVERSLGEMSALSYWKPSYLHRSGKAPAKVAELRALLATFDRFLPALPPAPRAYFHDLRSLVSDAVAFTDRWWAPGEGVAAGQDI